MRKYLEHSTLLNGKCIGCIEVNILPDDTWQFNFVTANKKGKNSIEKIEEKESIASIEELKKLFPSKTPVCIVINGKGIIYRKVEISGENTEDALLQNVLPNAVSTEFYVQSYTGNGKNIFVSLIRRQLLENVIQFFRDHKILISAAYWGPLVASSLIPVFGIEDEEIISENHEFTIKNKRIGDIRTCGGSEKSVRQYNIGTERISSHSLLAFGGLITHFFNGEIVTTSAVKCVNDSRNDFYYSRLFVKSGWAVLVIVFAALLLNFILFEHYNKKQQELYSYSSSFSDLLLNKDTLEKQLTDKKNLLEKSGLLKSSRISFYTDRLVSVMDEAIILTKLSVNPVEKSNTEDDDNVIYTFKDDVIEITGTTEKSSVLNNWVKDMKNFQWVKYVAIKNYNQSVSSKPASFTLEISLNENE